VYESWSLANYYETTSDLRERIGRALEDPRWGETMEGHSQGFHEKVKLIQRVANDVRVNTICEIGFNSGYSALNFLMSNRNATVISFDIFQWKYSAVANIALNDMFPDRNFIAIAGDSKHSIPLFQKTLNLAHKKKSLAESGSGGDAAILDDHGGGNTPLCNLIFIDGGHSRDAFLSDLKSMRALADPAHHTVLIDDFHASTISDAYYEQEAMQFVQHTRVFENIKLYDFTGWQEEADGSLAFTHKEYVGRDGRGLIGAVATCEYVF
jgi:hypothetical protein